MSKHDVMIEKTSNGQYLFVETEPNNYTSIPISEGDFNKLQDKGVTDLTK